MVGHRYLKTANGRRYKRLPPRMETITPAREAGEPKLVRNPGLALAVLT
jgi:hypothetical protein